MPRKVNQRKSVTVDGMNLKGEDRQYKFQLMHADAGLQLFHQHAQPFMQICAIINGHFEDLDDEKETANLTFVIMNCVDALKPDEFARVREAVLVGYENRDPLEVYSALYHALMANYGSTIDPLLASLADSRADSSSSPTKTDPTPAD